MSGTMVADPWCTASSVLGGVFWLNCVQLLQKAVLFRKGFRSNRVSLSSILDSVTTLLTSFNLFFFWSCNNTSRDRWLDHLDLCLGT